jgi:hypothetical protein
LHRFYAVYKQSDRPTDLGGEPSLKDMTVKAIQLL